MIQKILIFLLLVSYPAFSQQKILYNYDTPLSCEKLYQGVYDNKLYMYLNNKVYIKPEGFKTEEIYKLEVGQDLYYISLQLKKIVENVLKEQNCINIKISPVDTVESFKRKIVRD